MIGFCKYSDYRTDLRYEKLLILYLVLEQIVSAYYYIMETLF